jgi:hypothetical protein
MWVLIWVLIDWILIWVLKWLYNLDFIYINYYDLDFECV